MNIDKLKKIYGYFPAVLSMAVANIIYIENIHGAETVKSIQQITTAVQNPKMKQEWQRAYENGELPPLNQIPVPEKPLSIRRPVQLAESDLQFKNVRPIIPDKVPVAIQVFSKQADLQQYQGRFEIVSAKQGILSGSIKKGVPLELIYKLPQSRQLSALSRDREIYIDFSNTVVQSTLMQRVIVYEKTDRTPIMLSISEGSNQPYRRDLEKYGLKISQQPTDKENSAPPVKISYQGKSVVVNMGQQAILKAGAKQLKVYLRSSYAHTGSAESMEGLPYYVSLIIYE